jgi:hypothetical protein
MPTNEGATAHTSGAEWPALAAIAGVFALGWALVSPWRDVPVIDDWVYASSVEHLVKTGQLQVSDYSAVYPIAQILWGSLFARVSGFSFGALRLSTIVLAVFGCWAIYFTLRELKVNATLSLLAALTVALSPVYYALAFTFMTDVPFVSVSSVALFFYVSAFVRDRPQRLWWGSLVAVTAYLVRPLALILPVAAAASLMTGQSKRDVRRLLPPLAGAIVVMLALWIGLPRVLGRLPILDQRSERLRYLALVPLKDYAYWDLNLPFIALFPFAPLLLAAVMRGKRAILISIGAVGLMIVLRIVTGAVPSPLPDWQTWSLQDIATRGGLFGGELQPSAWSVRVTPFLRVAGAFVVSAFFVGCVMIRHRELRAARIVVVVGLLYVVAFNLLWFFNDRYYLVLAPTLAYLAAAPLDDDPRVMWIAVPVLFLWGFFGITGVRDVLATNEVVARITRELEADGVPPSDIDAGYTSNGWRLYVHPEHLPANADPRYDVPFITSAGVPRYRIVNVPGPDDEVLRAEALPAAWWQVTDRLYVVRRRTPSP